MKFLKIFLAALLAVVVGGVLSTLLWIVVLCGIAGSFGSTPTVVTDNSILKIDMAENILDAPSSDPFGGINPMTMEQTGSITLYDALSAIDKAKSDDRIKGLYINLTGNGGISGAGIEELRKAVVDFKQSGKFVVAYNDNYSQGGYYLASAADKIYLQPEGGVSWAGMATTLMFFKNAMDRLGLHAEVFRPSVCKYKSAVEPYILNKMSDANRKQMQEMLDDMWGVITSTVGEARGIDVKELNRLADNLEVVFPEDAVKHKLVDALLYADQMDNVFAELGVEKNIDDEYNIVSLGEYCAANVPVVDFSSPKVGIVYANGDILDGDGEGDHIYPARLTETLARARKDKDIKAVVLRVNSPGGSALASDEIWREVELLKNEKPVIVSMGAYAASGGYYISCGADAIVADRLTLTGSIGVFGLFVEGGDMLRNKAGLTFDCAKTNRSADFGQSAFGMLNLRKSTPAEHAMLIRSVDKVYATFTGKVAEGRNMPLEKVLEVAEGRVWSGERALGIGLVDINGGLKDAIAIAADKAGIADNFAVTEVLEELSPIAALMQSVSVQARARIMGGEEFAAWQEFTSLKQVLNRQGIQAYCPVEVRM